MSATAGITATARADRTSSWLQPRWSDRKSTRLNSSHGYISYAVFCLKKKTVAGGLSQSAVNEKAGAKTPLSLIFASVTLALCLLFFTGFLKNLPKAVLAAIVLMAIKGLINLKEIAHLWRVSRVEFIVAIIALAGVLLLGILKGVIVAAVA